MDGTTVPKISKDCKDCKDCKFYKYNIVVSECTFNPHISYDIVDGTKYTSYTSCELRRYSASDDKCGTNAGFFQPKFSIIQWVKSKITRS